MTAKTKKIVLTERQLSALKELSQKGVVAHYMPYRGRFNPTPYWFLTSTHRRATREVERLSQLGFVDQEHKDSYGEHSTGRISEKGRAYLRGLEETP